MTWQSIYSMASEGEHEVTPFQFKVPRTSNQSQAHLSLPHLCAHDRIGGYALASALSGKPGLAKFLRCVMRSAGILIPDDMGQRTLAAGFGQIESQVIKVGMVAEATCLSKPWSIIPMVVTGEQDYIAAGQFRGGEQLADARQVQAPGTILAILEPIYKGGLDGVTPGSSCIVNAYTSNHDLIASKETGAFKGFVLHSVDAVGIVHAMLLRIQALVLPIKTLVLNGH
jgi:hypothetical protein